jgi:hypothetical protein
MERPRGTVLGIGLICAGDGHRLRGHPILLCRLAGVPHEVNGVTLIMAVSWRFVAIASVVAVTVFSGGVANNRVQAQVTMSHPTATAGPSAGHTGAGTGGRESPTAAPIVTPDTRTPTPSPAATKSGALQPIIVEVGFTAIASGLGQATALTLANRSVPSLLIAAPTYAPKGYALRRVHVDPAQDQQTSADAYLQYAPKGAAEGKTAYPSYLVGMKSGFSTVLYPGVKPQVVTINPGKNGMGVIKGTVVDLKPVHGSEIVHIVWNGLTTSYDVSSNVTVSKLSVKDLLAVAGSIV